MLADLRAESDDLDAVIAGAGPDAPLAPDSGRGLVGRADARAPLVLRRRRSPRARAARGVRRDARRAVRRPGRRTSNGTTETIRDLGDALVPVLARRSAVGSSTRSPLPTRRNACLGTARPMSLMSFGTARLMETWAHGQDIADALGVRRTPTDRLRHIAYIGVNARTVLLRRSRPGDARRPRVRRADLTQRRGVDLG